MSFKLEKIEKSVATLNLEISAEAFEAAVQKAYNKNKHRFNVPGFRKGKAPRVVVERNYGEGVFYEEALDIAFPDAYSEAIKELDLKAVSAPIMSSLDKIGKDGVSMVLEVAVEPEFELGNYKGIEINSLSYEVTDEDIEKELAKIADTNARMLTITEGKAEKDDSTVIDFEGFVDGVAFEGGKGEDYTLVLGSNTFIPGFEDQLIGAEIGKEIDVNVTFPEEYHAEDLKGKPAVFKVTIKEVKRKELPELDDEFAKDVSEFDTLAEYKESLKDVIQKREEAALKNQAKEAVMEKIIENTSMDIPEQMITDRAEQVKKDFEMQISQSGIDPKTYYEVMKAQQGEDGKDFDALYKEQAVKDIQSDLIVKKIVEKEEIKATDEELEKEYENFAKAYNQSLEEFKESLNDYVKEYISNIVVQNKVYEFLLDNAKQK